MAGRTKPAWLTFELPLNGNLATDDVDPAASSMLEAAREARRKGTRVEIDFAGACLSLSKHPRAWGVVRAMLRAAGPSLRLVNGQLDWRGGPGQKVPSMSVCCECSMERMHLACAQQLYPASIPVFVDVTAGGGLRLVDCTLECEPAPATGSGSKGSGTRSGGSGSSKSAGTGVRISSSSAAAGFSAFQTMGKGAQLHAKGTRMQGFDRVLILAHGAHGTFEGCDIQVAPGRGNPVPLYVRSSPGGPWGRCLLYALLQHGCTMVPM